MNLKKSDIRKLDIRHEKRFKLLKSCAQDEPEEIRHQQIRNQT